MATARYRAGRFIALTADPRVSPGYSSKVGTIGRDASGNVYMKTGAGDTQWRFLELDSTRGPFVTGIEYLSAWHKSLLAGTGGLILPTGDSTTLGTGNTAGHRIWELLPAYAASVGAAAVTCSTDRGQSGKNTHEWVTTYLAGDIALAPKVWVIRWGLNDIFQGRTLAQFQTDLRTALATIRGTAGQDVASASIILCPPNASDYLAPSGTDVLWHDQYDAVVRQAAADYACCYVDVYHYLRDGIGTNGATWLDTIGGTQHIHPQDVAQHWIANLLGDVLFPRSLFIDAPNTPTLLNGWTALSSNTVPTVIKHGRLIGFTGMIHSGTMTTGTQICALPTGWGRPVNKDSYFLAPTDTTPASLRVAGDALYIKTMASNAWVDLSGCKWFLDG